MQNMRLTLDVSAKPHACCLQLRSAQRCPPRHRSLAAAASQGQTDAARKAQPGDGSKDKRGGLGDLLGPIGLTLGGQIGKKEGDGAEAQQRQEQPGSNGSDGSSNGRQNGNGNGARRGGGGMELGPIALSFAEDQQERLDSLTATLHRGDGDGAEPSGEKEQQRLQSIHSMTTEEWRAAYETDGAVDLWVEEEFNAGSRLTGGRDVHKGGLPGFGAGEGPSAGTAVRHTVRIHNPAAGQDMEVEVPEDRYILHEAEEQGLLLPWACRMGCCTACAVRVVSGTVHQPQALGISRGLREAGYALMCISYPRSDAVLECIEEDEIYNKQFGEAFAAQALDPNDKRNVLRDDYALEIADMDE